MSIDSLVAERVCGREIIEGSYPAMVRRVPGEVDMNQFRWEWLTKYSEDIGACFAEVVPAMEGFDLELLKTGVLENTTWEARFWNDYYGAETKKEGIAYESTPALAICLAALRAVGVTEEEMRAVTRYVDAGGTK